MKKRKWLKTILFCGLISAMVSTASLPAFAAAATEDTTVTVVNGSTVNLEAKAKSGPTGTFDLENATVKTNAHVFAEGENVAVSNSKIDMSRAVLISELNQAQALQAQADEAENQAPIAGLYPIVLNPETMKDGNYTPDTVVFLAWRWNNLNYTYDPDQEVLDLHINGIPTSYMEVLTADDQSYEGVLVQFANPGTYHLEYFAQDPHGATSNIVTGTFEIVHSGSYVTYDGALASKTDVKSYDVSVDFSTWSEFAIGVARTGNSDITFTVEDASGNQIGSKTLKPSYFQTGRDYILLTKPAGVDQAIYKVKVTGGNTFVAGDSSFHVVAGGKSQLAEMFQDTSSVVELQKFHNFDSTQTDYRKGYSPNHYTQYVFPNQKGNWYTYTADGSTTVMLQNHTTEDLRFKILDSKDLNVLFDSNENAACQYLKADGGYLSKATLNMSAGTKYYIVVYSTQDTASPLISAGGYQITAGEPRLEIEFLDITLPSINLQSGKNSTISFTVNAPDTAYATMFSTYYRSSDLNNLTLRSFTVKPPRSGKWWDVAANYAYFPQQADQLVGLGGTWQLQYPALRTGTLPSVDGVISYLYEI